MVANGNDVDLFRYDVWLRDRKTARNLATVKVLPRASGPALAGDLRN